MVLITPIDWQFRLGDIYFNTAGQPDDLGCQWSMPTPDGWDAAEFRGSTLPIPFADGADIGQGYKGPRIIHGQAGQVVAQDAAGIERAKRRLQLTLDSMNRADGLFYGRRDDMPHDGSGDCYCVVRTAGKPVWTRNGPESAGFDFLLNAGDPRKLSVAVTTLTIPSSTSIGGATYPMTYPVTYTAAVGSLPPTGSSTNTGNAPASFIATFVGPLVNPVLGDNAGGQRIPLLTSIATGRSIIVDTLAQTVMTDDGVSVYSYYDDVTGTALDELAIPAAAEDGTPGRCDWVLQGQGGGHVTVTSHNDVSA